MINQKYLCIQRSEPGHEKPSPAQMQELYASFQAWKEKFQTNIVDLGGPLKADGRVVKSSGVSDGPFAESKEIIGGFMIIQAESWEKAIEVVKESPGVFFPGSSVEVREMNSP